MTTRLERLRYQLLGASQRAIRREHPDFERRYREALGAAATHEDFLRAAVAVADIQTPRFTRWRQLLLAMFDLELGIARLETAHALLEVLPREELCRQLRITRGHWADYTYVAWLFAAQAALERADRLATRAWRALIRQYPSMGAVVDLRTLSQQLRVHIAAIEKLRNAEAHGGGTIDVLADRRRIDEWAVLGEWPPVEDILERFPSTTHLRQAEMAHEMTRRYFEVIDATAGAILSSVDWGALL